VREGLTMMSGSMVAVVTPMDADGSVNYRQFAKLIDFHVDSGTQVLVVAGTTGESATLDHEEHIGSSQRLVSSPLDAFR
jgi:4-hydroxy-tetrahydrodipicolinate synthase